MPVERVFHPIGERVLTGFDSIGRYVMMVITMLRLLFRGRIHWRNTMEQFAFIGSDSLLIVLLTGLSVGAVFTLQVADQFVRYGASTVIGGAAAMAIVRELAPLMTGVVVAGRVGAAIAAEVGSMKVTEQLDALEAMAVSPVYYLAIPRMVACCAMLPLLTAFSIAIGIGGGFLVAVAFKGINPFMFLESVQYYLVLMDIFKALFKSAIFGVIIASIGCFQGFHTGEGAQGVGRATTNSVVMSLISIFVTNYFMSAILFSKGVSS